MDKTIQARVEEYIQEVMKAQLVAAHRPVHGRLQLVFLDENLLVLFDTGFDGVNREVEMELRDHLRPICRYPFRVIFDKIGDRGDDGSFYSMRYADGEYVDINHSLACVRLLENRWYFVENYIGCKYSYPEFDPKLCSRIYSRLRDLHGGKPAVYQGVLGWKQYCVDYEILYGHRPEAQRDVEVYPMVKF